MTRAADLGYRLVRPGLFRLGDGDAETAHKWTLARLGTVDRFRVARALTRVYAVMSLIVCAVVWFNVVAGLLVVSARGVG